MKERIARSLFWMVWSRGGVQAISFLSTMLVARWLTPGDYGVMALVGIWTGTIAMLAEMGLGGAIVQFQDLEHDELNACFWLTLATTTAAYLVLYAAAPLIAGWFDSPRVVPALRVSGLTLLLTAVRIVPDAMLRKDLRLDRIAQAEMLSALMTIPLTLSLAWTGAGLWALVVGVLCQGVIQAAAVMWWYPWRPRWSFRSHRLGAMLRYSLSAVGANIGWSVFSQLDSAIIGKMIGEHALGLYSMAKHLATLPVTRISVVVNTMMFPMLSRWQDNDLQLQTSFFKVLRLVGCITIPISLGMALVAHDVIRIALGPAWSPIVPVFQIFCLYALIHAIEVLFPPVLLARYRTTFLFWWTAALLAVMPIPFAIAAWWGGALGVAVTWVVVYPLLMCWMAREALKELGLGLAAVLQEIKPIVPAALTMAGVVLLMVLTLRADSLAASVVRLLAAVTTGASVYGAIMLWRSRRIADEVLELGGWLLARGRVFSPAK